MPRFITLLHKIITPSAEVDPVRGYGVTLRQSHPEMSQAVYEKIADKHTSMTSLFLAALIVGLVCGVAAFLLKLFIGSVGRWLTVKFVDDGQNWWLIALPIIGILFVGILQRYVLHRDLYHGEGRLRDDFRRNSCYLPIALTYEPILAATLTLGFGGSAGSEGPIAYTGGAIGSNVASRLNLSPAAVRIMMAIGAGAGIAGIFKAPVGGMMFTLEVIGIALTTEAVVALVVACVVSGLTAFTLSGFTPDISFTHQVAVDYSYLGVIAVFGVFCGVYSFYYFKILHGLGNRLLVMKNPWIKNILSGVIIGVMVCLFPPLYGEGYGSVASLLDGDFSALLNGTFMPRTWSVPILLILTSGCIMIAKAFTTSATNNGGGVAGNFAPTIMIGSVAGFFFAYSLNHFCGMSLPVSDYVFMGMAGVLAGVIRAPLMSMFLITEMSSAGYKEFMPVAIVAVLSWFVFCLLDYFTRSRGRRQ